jgi:diguanylate cyclase (GGDEF)-like protein
MLERLSQIDGLSGIWNRRRFDEMLQIEWRRASRGPRAALSLVMVDIDCFKQFNDHYGHLAGDDCIRQVARTLSTSAQRAGDFVARYGGEEFACILPGIDAEGARQFGEKVREEVLQLAIPHEASSAGAQVTISVGVASVAHAGHGSATALVDEADRALYRAKEAGRNRVSR